MWGLVLFKDPSDVSGMGPQHTMQIAERLYTQGYISYPRTETTHYPENFDLKAVLKQQTNSSMWAEEVRADLSGSHVYGPVTSPFLWLTSLLPRQVKALLSGGLNRPRKGSDAGDHPPITPMRAASEGELGEADAPANHEPLVLETNPEVSCPALLRDRRLAPV